MKLSKSKLKQLIKETLQEYGPGAYQAYEEDEFQDIVAKAVDQLGGDRVLEIVRGVVGASEE